MKRICSAGYGRPVRTRGEQRFRFALQNSKVKKYCFFFLLAQNRLKNVFKNLWGEYFQGEDGAIPPSGQNSRHHLFTLLQQVVSTQNSSNADRSLKGKIKRKFRHMKLKWKKIISGIFLNEDSLTPLHFGQNDNIANSDYKPSKTSRTVIFYVNLFIVPVIQV